MAAKDPAVRHISAKIGAIGKHHPNADTTELHRELQAAKLAEHIRRLVDAAPPLSQAQRAHLAALLLPPEREVAAA